MNKGAKNILIALAVVVVLLAAGAIYLVSQLDRIVAELIEEQGSAATATAVRVGGVSISLKDARGELSKLTVANPEGFAGNALELGHFAIRIDPSTLTSDVIVIEEITVTRARINVSQQGAKNNIRELMKNLDVTTDEGKSSADSGKPLIIERFVLEEARASVSLPDLQEEKEAVIPAITLTDIGRASNGAYGAEIARQLLKPILDRALRSAAAQSLKDQAQEKIDEAQNRLLDELRDKLGGDDDSGQ